MLSRLKNSLHALQIFFFPECFFPGSRTLFASLFTCSQAQGSLLLLFLLFQFLLLHLLMVMGLRPPLPSRIRININVVFGACRLLWPRARP